MFEMKYDAVIPVEATRSAVLRPLIAAMIAALVCAAIPEAHAEEKSMFGEAPSIAGKDDSDETKVELTEAAPNDERKVRINTDGTVTVPTRLGKFGPLANLNIKPAQIRPQRDDTKIVRYTDSGYPVTERQQKKLDAAHKLADAVLSEIKRKVEAGEMEPPNFGKHQADVWREKNREILEREKKYGRTTTKNYVHPGSTPEQSQLLYNESTYYIRDNALGPRKRAEIALI